MMLLHCKLHEAASVFYSPIQPRDREARKRDALRQAARSKRPAFLTFPRLTTVDATTVNIVFLLLLAKGVKRANMASKETTGTDRTFSSGSEIWIEMKLLTL